MLKPGPIQFHLELDNYYLMRLEPHNDIDLKGFNQFLKTLTFALCVFASFLIGSDRRDQKLDGKTHPRTHGHG